MAITSEDFRRLQQALEDDTKATRDLVAMLTKGVQAPGGNGPAAGAAGAGSGGAGAAARPGPGTSGGQAADFWNQGAKGDSAAGFGLSAVRQVLSAGGASAAAGIVGGLATGGPFGAGVAAIGSFASIAHQATEQRQGAVQARVDQFEHEPIQTSPTLEKFKFEQGKRLEAVNVEEAKLQGFFDSPREAEYRKFGYAAQRQSIQRETDRETYVELGAKDDLMRQLGPFARGGGDTHTDEFKKLTQELMGINSKRRRDDWDLRSQLSPLTPGANSHNAGK